MLTKNLTRDELRYYAAGKFAYMNMGVVDWKQLEVFVEGFVFAIDTKFEGETIKNKTLVGSVVDESANEEQK